MTFITVALGGIKVSGSLQIDFTLIHSLPTHVYRRLVCEIFARRLVTLGIFLVQAPYKAALGCL